MGRNAIICLSLLVSVLRHKMFLVLEGGRGQTAYCEALAAEFVALLQRIHCPLVWLFPNELRLPSSVATSPRCLFLARTIDFYDYEHRVNRFGPVNILAMHYFHFAGSFRVHQKSPRPNHIFYVNDPDDPQDLNRFRRFCQLHHYDHTVLQQLDDTTISQMLAATMTHLPPPSLCTSPTALADDPPIVLDEEEEKEEGTTEAQV